MKQVFSLCILGILCMTTLPLSAYTPSPFENIYIQQTYTRIEQQIDRYEDHTDILPDIENWRQSVLRYLRKHSNGDIPLTDKTVYILEHLREYLTNRIKLQEPLSDYQLIIDFIQPNETTDNIDKKTKKMTTINQTFYELWPLCKPYKRLRTRCKKTYFLQAAYIHMQALHIYAHPTKSYSSITELDAWLEQISQSIEIALITYPYTETPQEKERIHTYIDDTQDIFNTMIQTFDIDALPIVTQQERQANIDTIADKIAHAQDDINQENHTICEKQITYSKQANQRCYYLDEETDGYKHYVSDTCCS